MALACCTSDEHLDEDIWTCHACRQQYHQSCLPAPLEAQPITDSLFCLSCRSGWAGPDAYGEQEDESMIEPEYVFDAGDEADDEVHANGDHTEGSEEEIYGYPSSEGDGKETEGDQSDDDGDGEPYLLTGHFAPGLGWCLGVGLETRPDHRGNCPCAMLDEGSDTSSCITEVEDHFEGTDVDGEDTSIEDGEGEEEMSEEGMSEDQDEMPADQEIAYEMLTEDDPNPHDPLPRYQPPEHGYPGCTPGAWPARTRLATIRRLETQIRNHDTDDEQDDPPVQYWSELREQEIAQLRLDREDPENLGELTDEGWQYLDSLCE